METFKWPSIVESKYLKSRIKYRTLPLLPHFLYSCPSRFDSFNWLIYCWFYWITWDQIWSSQMQFSLFTSLVIFMWSSCVFNRIHDSMAYSMNLLLTHVYSYENCCLSIYTLKKIKRWSSWHSIRAKLQKFRQNKIAFLSSFASFRFAILLQQPLPK